ncbi:MAG: hypothetical protein ABIB47_00035 [Candidatus Woesearchaeota archaeon]
MKEKHRKTEKKYSGAEKATAFFLVLGLIFVVFNQFQLMSLGSGNGIVPTGVTLAQAAVIPTGTPEIYGGELGISYDGVSTSDPGLADQTIAVMSNLDRTLTLEGDDLERYIDVVSEISCEYCCGAQSIIVRRADVESMNQKIEAAIESGEITEDQAERYRKEAGDSACGCAHSYAMRGLAKYLIIEHGDEFTDEEILGELSKWKTLYFPGQMTAKAAIMEEKGIEFSYAALGSNENRDIEKGATAGSGMVGGC